MNSYFKPTVGRVKSGYRGGEGLCPPLSNFRVGTVPPLRIVPRLSSSGGREAKMNHSGGGQGVCPAP